MTQVQIWDGSEDETGSMSYGNMVQIKHGEELTTLYAHLSEINVQEGDTVVRGQRIGRIGDTGNATGVRIAWLTPRRASAAGCNELKMQVRPCRICILSSLHPAAER